MINTGIMKAWQNWALVIFVGFLISITLNSISGCKCKEKGN